MAQTLSKRSRAQDNRDNQTLEKKIMGVPARIMRPRLMLIGVVIALVAFGVVMIYSASSVKALYETGDAAYYVKRQIICIILGLVLMAFTALVDYHLLRDILPVLLIITVGILLAVRLFGKEENGATRWIELGVIRLQPSEFAKATIVLAAAEIAGKFYGERTMGPLTFIVKLVLYIALPLVLILIQPDNGTTAIIGVMLLTVMYSSGFPRDKFIKLGFALAVVFAIIVLAVPYARQRVFTVFTVAQDTQGDGYQLNQGFIAFGSGGLFGLGLGMSRQKYYYLFAAHTDFIFAIIGEELGLIGTLAVIAAFALFAYEALQIAHNAPDYLGRLIVIGCLAIFLAQAFINMGGVTGITPLTGKTLPFLSYGGSSIMSCLMLVGLMINVSLRSSLPETEHDRRRRSFELASASEEVTGVGEAHVRGAAAPSGASVSLGTRRNSRPSLRVVEGGSGGADSSSARTKSRKSGHQGGYERINLGPDPSSRLRSADSSPKLSSGKSSRSSTRSGKNKRS